MLKLILIYLGGLAYTAAVIYCISASLFGSHTEQVVSCYLFFFVFVSTTFYVFTQIHKTFSHEDKDRNN